MASGFVQRFKGKITTFVGGIYQGGAPSQAVFVNAGVPTGGTSGTLAGIATIGSLLIDTTNGVTYQNTGTAASPTWTVFAAGGNAAITGGTITGATFTNNKRSVTNPVTALGSTRAGATVLATTDINVIATAAAGTGVQLVGSATLGIGGEQILYNNTATAIKVYGAGSDTIDTIAATTGVTMSATTAAKFTVLASTTFQSNLLGLKSA